MSQLDAHIGLKIILKLNFYSWAIIEGISRNCRHIEILMQLHVDSGLLGITSYSRQDPEMAWRSFFAVQQQKMLYQILGNK